MKREDIQKLIDIRNLDVRIMEVKAELDLLPEEYALEEQGAGEARDKVAAVTIPWPAGLLSVGAARDTVVDAVVDPLVRAMGA